mgnify:CR=1 FL=1
MIFTEERRKELRSLSEIKYSDVYREYGGEIVLELNGTLKFVVDGLRAEDPDEYDHMRPRDLEEDFIDTIKHLGRNMRVKGKTFKIDSAKFNSHNSRLTLYWEAPLKDHKDVEAASDMAEIAIAGPGHHFNSGLIHDVSEEWYGYKYLIFGPPDHRAANPKIVEVGY